MDNKGFISIEYVFSIFVILIIAVPLLFLSQSAIESSFNIDDDIAHRLVLDTVASEISQVNSNGDGYSKTIKLPSNVGYYKITVENKKLTIEYDDKREKHCWHCQILIQNIICKVVKVMLSLKMMGKL